ncbi:hypothetical protein QJS04_geneDACA011581 [Acorus gramineus]|uniref:Reverse transcriptase n=1 Tax=Acorus gramineus TaxID=55184 RepID=A0AAV9ABU4_ACOGR|nr:hypothetical protein QJS04_geneDACA011581 [Acorus gramineus]
MKLIVVPPLQSHPKPFKFFIAWLRHDTFMDTLKQAWSVDIPGTAMYRLAKKLQHTKLVLKAWSLQHFGRAQERVGCTRERLATVQITLQNDPLNKQLIVEEEEFRAQYEEALKREEEIFCQKARLNWLQEGDSCTKFFYSQFAARKSHNTLRKVVLPDGQELVDPKEVQHYTVDYYQSLLNKETYHPIPPLLAARKLNEDDNHLLCAEVTKEEIVDNLKQMKGDGSPGPDGFTVGFFQHCWDVVKEDLILAV